MDVKPVYLIMITEQNNNKYYNCFPNGDGTFTVKYGRVGGHESTTSYPMSKLRNDEIIVYTDKQMTIRYLVEIR